MTASQKLEFYATPPHDCNYLSNHEAVTLFADPHIPKNSRLYTALADCGFRRSGSHLYIPHCKDCSSCISIRVPVAEFEPSRSQRRVLAKNKDIVINELAPNFVYEHFDLYKKYLSYRHNEGGMDNPTQKNYMEFLTAPWSNTIFYEMRLSGTLIGVATADILDNALSAVYTFFDPAHSQRSLGKFSILYQIEQTRLRGHKWLYLGYWIEKCRKMSYKTQYQPHELFLNNKWQRQDN